VTNVGQNSISTVLLVCELLSLSFPLSLHFCVVLIVAMELQSSGFLHLSLFFVHFESVLRSGEKYYSISSGPPALFLDRVHIE
jgi:hypothetical protein